MRKNIEASIVVLIGIAVTGFMFKPMAKIIDQPVSGRQEIVDYCRQNILSVLQAQKSKLNEYLSADEKQQIEDMSVQLRALRQKMISQRTRWFSDIVLSEVNPPSTFTGRRQQNIVECQQICCDAYMIADKHRSEIFNLLDEIRDQHSQRRTDCGI